jgi:hypothetical protein
MKNQSPRQLLSEVQPVFLVRLVLEPPLEFERLVGT